MNKDRRARLQELVEALACIQEEEQEAFDNMPESLQESERGEAMQEAIDAMDEAKDALDGILAQ